MLLSIDRVLQLLAEGKSLEKISELAGCYPSDVAEVIENARTLLKKSSKEESRRKILIKKKDTDSDTGGGGVLDLKQKFGLIELSAIPYNDTLIVHAESRCEGSPGNAAIGLVLYDKNDQPVGKLSAFIGKKKRVSAALIAILRAIEVAANYKPLNLRIITGSDRAVKLINGSLEDDSERVLKLLAEINEASSDVAGCRIEYASGQLIEKAAYLAEKTLADRAAEKNVR